MLKWHAVFVAALVLFLPQRSPTEQWALSVHEVLSAIHGAYGPCEGDTQVFLIYEHVSPDDQAAVRTYRDAVRVLKLTLGLGCFRVLVAQLQSANGFAVLPSDAVGPHPWVLMDPVRARSLGHGGIKVLAAHEVAHILVGLDEHGEAHSPGWVAYYERCLDILTYDEVLATH